MNQHQQNEQAQDEFFDDIVANTDVNLYIMPTSTIFSAKRNRHLNNNQRATTIFDGFGYKNAASECHSLCDDKLDFNDDEFADEMDNLSDFVDESDRHLVFDFLRLRIPEEDINNHHARKK